MKYLFQILFFLVIGILSCKKDVLKEELVGDKAKFKGTWHWVYSDHYYGWCSGDNLYEVLTPISENTLFKIEFLETGFIRFCKNDSLISEYRITFEYFNPLLEECVILNANHFIINFNGFNSKQIAGCINEDTIRFAGASGFLFFEESGCETYQNVFIKE